MSQLHHHHTATTDSSERRAAARIVTVCRLVKLSSSRGEGLARCRNISNGGVQIETHMPVKVRDRVSVCFGPNIELDGRVVWIDGCDSGVSFDAPVDCIAVLRESSPSKPGARPPRVKAALPVSISYPGGVCASLVHDISLQGMKVTNNDGSLYPGLNVTVMLADGRARRAIVCWSRYDVAGLQMIDRFRLDELPPLMAQ